MKVLQRGQRSSLLGHAGARRAVLAAALATIGAVGPCGIASADAARLPGAGGTVWVTDRAGQPGGLFALDAGSGEVIERVAIGLNPIGAVAPVGTRKVYATNETSNSVSVVSKSPLREVKQIPTGAGSKPHHLVEGRGGRSVYAALFGSSTVAVIDTTVDEVAGTLAMSSRPGVKTHAVSAGRDGRTLYGANTFGPTPEPQRSGTVSAVDTGTGRLLWEVEVGRNPSEVLVTRDARTAYVSVRDEDVVKVLDLTGDQPTIVGEGFVGDQPDTLQLTSDGQTLVVALRGTPAQVALLNTSTLVAKFVGLPGTTTGHQWLSTNGRYTFVAVEDPAAPGVAVIDNRTGAFVEKFVLPAGTRPHGVFYEPSRLR